MQNSLQTVRDDLRVKYADVDLLQEMRVVPTVVDLMIKPMIKPPSVLKYGLRVILLRSALHFRFLCEGHNR